MQIKGLLFDNDGVLTHTERTFFKVNKKIFDSMNIPYTEQDFIEHTFDTGLGTSGWMKKNQYDTSTIKYFTQTRNDLFSTEILKADTCEPAAKSVLTTLKNDYTLLIVTNTQRDVFQLTHKTDEVYSLFDEVVYREDYEKPKPAPDAYVVALKKANLEANEVIVIEDSPRGMKAAQNAGIKVIAVTNPHFPNLNTKEAEYHINSLDELPDLLNHHNNVR